MKLQLNVLLGKVSRGLVRWVRVAQVLRTIFGINSKKMTVKYYLRQKTPKKIYGEKMTINSGILNFVPLFMHTRYLGSIFYFMMEKIYFLDRKINNFLMDEWYLLGHVDRFI